MQNTILQSKNNPEDEWPKSVDVTLIPKASPIAHIQYMPYKVPINIMSVFVVFICWVLIEACNTLIYILHGYFIDIKATKVSSGPVKQS